MGLDRVVILLINSSDMSAAVAAGTPRRSPTKPWAGPPTGITAHTSVGALSIWRPPWARAGRLLEKNSIPHCRARETDGNYAITSVNNNNSEKEIHLRFCRGGVYLHDIKKPHFWTLNFMLFELNVGETRSAQKK